MKNLPKILGNSNLLKTLGSVATTVGGFLPGYGKLLAPLGVGLGALGSVTSGGDDEK